MTFSKVLYHDIRCGLCRRRYILVSLLFLPPLIDYCSITRAAPLPGTWMDMMCFLFKGIMPISSWATTNERIQLPIVWIYTFGCSLIMSLDYILYDLTQNGQQVIIRCGSRRKWFLSKCIWNILSSVCFFLSLTVTVTFISLITSSNLSFSLTPNIWQTCFKIELADMFPACHLMLAGVMLPLLTMIALNLLEMTLCLFVKPPLCFLGCVGILIFAAWADHDFILGCGGMVIRNASMCNNVIALLRRAIIAVIYSGVWILLGIFRFKCMNILPREE